VIGLSGALAATRILRTLVYEVKPSDPQTYLSRRLRVARGPRDFSQLSACPPRK
jgi:hypothetical protein